MMSNNKTYNPKPIRLFPYGRIGLGLLFCFIVFTSFQVNEAEATIEIRLNPIVSFDELSVNCVVNDYLKFENDIVISESNNVCIDIESLFRNIGIKCISENDGNQLSGFVEDESKTYLIDYEAKQVTVGKRTIKSENGFIKESGKIYVEKTIITEAFGLNVLFNYRSLSMKMDMNYELPVIKKMRLEQMRKNLSKLQHKAIVADTVVARDYHLFNFGMIDWALNSSQTEHEATHSSARLGVGAEVLYGELTATAYYDNRSQFDKDQFYYRWRFVDNDQKYIKQAQAGKINTQTIAFMNSSLIGASINNSPTTVRKATGYYTINEYTEPNWEVELYINDVLVDYTSADAAGLYLFKVPIVYGYTTLKLKFYGPMGEERMEERVMNTPYTFTSAKTLEYSITGGVLQNDEATHFGKGEVNYGVNRILTVGGGVEYLSSIPNDPYIPFATLAFQPISQLVLDLEYAHGVRMTGLLNYSFSRSASLELNYSKYEEGQLATRFNADEERKVRLSIPFKIKKVSGYGKVDFQQMVYGNFTSNRLDGTLSEYYKNFSTNLSLLNSWVASESVYSTANLSLSYRIKNGLVFRPSTEYSINNSDFTRCRAQIEKRVAKMYLSASYERNFLSQSNLFFLSFSYDLNFARLGASASYTDNGSAFSESASGSLAFGGENNYVKAGHNSALGKGGILFYPFLDLNQNGVKDDNEQMVLLSSVRVSGGRAFISEKDSIVRISDLNAFINYTVEFSDNDLDNIAWQLKHKTYQILVDPHQYKRIDLAVVSVGEVSGMVYYNDGDHLKGLGRVTVQIVDTADNVVAETLSESDGYFSYLGLESGDYTTRVDAEQLKMLKYQSAQASHDFFIKQLIDGDVVDGIDFVLQAQEKASSITDKSDSAGVLYLSEKSAISDVLDEKVLTDNTLVSEVSIPNEEDADVEINDNVKLRANINTSFTDISTTNEFFHTVGIGIYRNYVTADQLLNLDSIYYEVLANGTNRYFSGQYATVAEAKIARDEILAKGVKGAFVLSFENGEETVLGDVLLENVSPDSETHTDLIVESHVEPNIESVVKADAVPVRANINTSFTDISTTDEFFHTVGIGIYRNYVTADQLLNLDPIYYEVLANGTNRYFSGHYNTEAEAEKARDEILARGVEGAFVLSFENGKETGSDKAQYANDKLNTEINGDAVSAKQPLNAEEEKDTLKSVDEKNEGLGHAVPVLWKQYGNFFLILLLLLIVLGVRRTLKRKS